MNGQTAPLVSILMFCRNGARSVGRAIDSILANGYSNVDVVVQDGASTDGTLEILRGYGDRIEVVSEPDEGAADAFQRALLRCRGEIIGSCLVDEELLPGAIEKAVAYFLERPTLGAIIGDALLADEKGNVTGLAKGAQFDLVEYLFGNCSPYFCACFFSRAALIESGIIGGDADRECLEFEIWTRLATRSEIRYLPETFAKYAIRETQLSNIAGPILRHIGARARAIQKLFSTEGFYGPNERLRNYCLICQYRQFYAHAVTYGIERVLVELQLRMGGMPESATRKDFAQSWLYHQRARGYWLSFGNLFPPRLKRRILQLGLHRVVRPLFLGLAQRVLSGRGGSTEATAGQLWADETARLMICHETAMLYEARGQIDAALRLWARAEALGDLAIDSHAVQAKQKDPQTNAPDLLSSQRRWAKKHAPFQRQRIPLHSTSGRPLRVGYHCAWWDSPVARHQLLNFVKHHDRRNVAPIGYSPVPVSNDIAANFLLMRVTGAMSDETFASQIREDGIDILIETTGFSPDHRYRAMALRCAPIQISYLNHHGTTAVPNVDYVLGDAVAAGGDDSQYFTETIYRLPGCFFCFDLRAEQLPFTDKPPSHLRGFINFGCFGSGGKINDELIALWAALLERVPDSRLTLRNGALARPDTRSFMISRFSRHGIDEERLQLLEPVDHRTLLATYTEIDISLDTWPYCGGNTIAESFWQGVPVVSLLGNRFSARYGASLLRAHGCEELIASSPAEYIDIAAALAADPARLAALRQSLRQRASEYGFNDSEAFARKLEVAFRNMASNCQDA